MKVAILGHCFFCNVPLEDGSFYGSDDFPLCSFHNSKWMQLVYLMNTGKLLPEFEIDKMTEAKFSLDCHPEEKQLTLEIKEALCGK